MNKNYISTNITNENEAVSFKYFVCIAVLFIFGSSVVLGISTDVGINSWISFLISFVIVLPLLLLYARLIILHPQQNFFEMLVTTFGKILGKIFVVIFLFYSVHLSSLVMRNFSEYVKVVVMPDSPEILVLILMLLPVAYIAKSGVVTLSKWSAISSIVVVGVVLTTVLLSLNIFDIQNMLPLFDVKIKAILNSSVKTAAYPLGEMIMFLTIADHKAKKSNPYKEIAFSTYLSGFILLIVLFRNILTLGSIMKYQTFPSFIQAKIISITESFERIEGLISFNFILAGITKMSVCIIGVCKGLAVLFDSYDYKRYAFPVIFISLAISIILYENVMEMFEFIDYYHYYAAIFQGLIPIILWIAAEIRNLINKKKIKKSLKHASLSPSK